MKYKLSYWEQSTFFDDIDIAVIGGGIVGMSSALHLKQLAPTLKIAILERGTLPIGASTRNAGFACIGSMTELLDDMQERTQDEVFALVERRYKGLERLRLLLGDHRIEYNPCGGIELFKAEEEESFQQCLDHLPSFNKQLKSITRRSDCYEVVSNRIADYGFSQVDHLILNKAEGSIHMGKMVSAFIDLCRDKGIHIFNGIDLQHIENRGNEVHLLATLGIKIQCKKVLITTNAFAPDLLNNLEIKPARNQVIVTKPIPGLTLDSTFHYDKGYFYFRNVGKRLLIGGGRHLDMDHEMTASFGLTDRIIDALHDLVQTTILPNIEYEVEYKWSGIMGVGPSKSPIVQMMDENTCVAVRLGGMGVAIGTLVGQEAAELILSRFS